MVNIHQCRPMTDHFDGIEKLDEQAPRTQGAPNFRRLPGFSIFGTGQPTLAGFGRCLEPIGKKYKEEKQVIWVNLRQEPVVYVNGNPFTARDPKRLNYHLVVPEVNLVEKMESAFTKELRERGPKLLYYRDQYAEHPDERAANNEQLELELKETLTLNEINLKVIEKSPNVRFVRVPLDQEGVPSLSVFDSIASLLAPTEVSTPIVFNCQAGISRTTTAMVIAALVKESQLAKEFDRMQGIVPDDILNALRAKKLGLKPNCEPEEDEKRRRSNALMRGHFEVINELLKAYPEAEKAKQRVDKLIDLCSAPPRGTGVQNLREIIVENKMTFDVAADEWQAYLRQKIVNNIERYFYLIVFAIHLDKVDGHVGQINFEQFMKEHEDLKIMIEEGRDKLEWERRIPEEKLGELKEMLEADDFKANLSRVIKRIYELAWEKFSDLPRGHHKNNSMHKLASKTMLDILPDKLLRYIETKIGMPIELASTTPDFFDVIGQVSWYEEEKAAKEIDAFKETRARLEQEANEAKHKPKITQQISVVRIEEKENANEIKENEINNDGNKSNAEVLQEVQATA